MPVPIPGRLLRSSRRAWKLVGACGMLHDPKPWFYGGLFSLATPGEAERFLTKHPFVAAVVPSLACAPAEARLRGAGKATWAKIKLLREEIACLPEE